MSLRPRYAGQGRLRKPGWVTVLRADNLDGPERTGDLIGEHGDTDWDPFERTTDGILLAESFARCELSRPRKARQWLLDHGVLDLAHFFPDEPFASTENLLAQDFHDPRGDVLAQQANVRWHLVSLARLSAGSSGPEPGQTSWNPTWSQPAVRNSEGDVIWLGAPTAAECWIPRVVQRYSRCEDAPDDPKRADTPLGIHIETYGEAWWATAHASWQRVQRQQVPLLWVPKAGWQAFWLRYGAAHPTDGDSDLRWRPRTDRAGLVWLQLQLMAPFLSRAIATQGEVDFGLARQVPDGASVPLAPIEIYEARTWRSLLAPVYLQLFEALRRISEGHSGATLCKECGQPFLTLDARRSSFCNDRERFRFTQREHRKRLAASPPVVTKGLSR